MMRCGRDKGIDTSIIFDPFFTVRPEDHCAPPVLPSRGVTRIPCCHLSTICVSLRKASAWWCGAGGGDFPDIKLKLSDP